MPVLHLATPPPPLAPPPLAQSAPPAGRGTFEVRSPSSIRTYSPGMMSPAVAVPPAGLDSFANRPTAKIRTFHDAPVPSTPPRPPPQPEPVVYSPAVHSPAVHSPAGAGTAPKPAAGRSSSHDQSRDDLRRPATCDTPNSRALGSSRSLGFQGYIGSKARGGRSPLALPRHLRSEVHDIIYRGVWSENAMVMPERFQPGVRSTPGPCRNSASNPSRPSSAPSSVRLTQRLSHTYKYSTHACKSAEMQLARYGTRKMRSYIRIYAHSREPRRRHLPASSPYLVRPCPSTVTRSPPWPLFGVRRSE